MRQAFYRLPANTAIKRGESEIKAEHGKKDTYENGRYQPSAAALMLLMLTNMAEPEAEYSPIDIMESLFPYMNDTERVSVQSFREINRAAQNIRYLTRRRGSLRALPEQNSEEALFKAASRFCPKEQGEVFYRIGSMMSQLKEIRGKANGLPEKLKNGGPNSLPHILNLLNGFGGFGASGGKNPLNQLNNLSSMMNMINMINSLGGIGNLMNMMSALGGNNSSPSGGSKDMSNIINMLRNLNSNKSGSGNSNAPDINRILEALSGLAGTGS